MRQFDDLPEATQNQILALHANPQLQRHNTVTNFILAYRDGNGDRIPAELGQRYLDLIWVFTTNAYQLDKEERQVYRGYTDGLFLAQSRLNHSCYPNTTSYFEGGARVLTALRDVGMGEELTAAYVSIAEHPERLARQKYIRSQWHFACACELCEVDDLRVDTAEFEKNVVRMKAYRNANNRQDQHLLVEALTECDRLLAIAKALNWRDHATVLLT
ncbi:hypothetical protein BJ170DRAFT_597328 [Xylariales sp. AK1849]|nr:hypothetical protein BJ170DRAFT_597328 [Xylariales sp. AK1849]